MRLQRALARAGIASRRHAEDLIREGRVRVNGTVAELGMSADPDADTITVNGRRIAATRVVWIALHKPIGYVVSRRDPEGRKTVFELVPHVPGLTYVGRLDVTTAGLLLLTTDGTAVNRMTHPRYGVERSYRVLVHGLTTDQITRALSRPVMIEGRPVALSTFQARAAERGRTDMRLVLTEGRYRIVRRLCDQLGLKVERLTRLSHGPVRLGRLAAGKWRYLTRNELAALSSSRT
ncbi:MAG TPA: pseudouridine synthase [Gemmatimonadales bacterium]